MTTSIDNRILIATCPNCCEQTDVDECGHRSIFTEQDWQMFFALQDSPPEPTERMKKALQIYNEIIQNQT